MSTTVPTLAEIKRAKLDELIKAHKIEVARLREIYGDPDEALSNFVREHFSLEALLDARRFVDGLSEDQEDDIAW